MKKLFALLLLFFVGFTFVGCTSANKLSSINTKISSVYFAIDLGKSDFDSRNETEQKTIKAKIENLVDNYSALMKIRYYENLADLENVGKISSSQRILYKNHLALKTSWKNNVCLIQFEFYSQTASRIFLTSSDYSGAINKETAFATITTEKFKNVFSKVNAGTTIDLEEHFTKGINDSIDEIGLKEIKNIRYYYMFLSESSKLRSENADEVMQLNDGSIFCFYGNKNSEIEFEFNVVQSNVFAYYLLALGITAGFAIIYFVCVFIYKKKKKQKQKNEIDLNLENKES